jgi:hypothetical protein
MQNVSTMRTTADRLLKRGQAHHCFGFGRSFEFVLHLE